MIKKVLKYAAENTTSHTLYPSNVSVHISTCVTRVWWTTTRIYIPRAIRIPANEVSTRRIHKRAALTSIEEASCPFRFSDFPCLSLLLFFFRCQAPTPLSRWIFVLADRRFWWAVFSVLTTHIYESSSRVFASRCFNVTDWLTSQGKLYTQICSEY